MLRDKNDGKRILLKIALMRAWETVLYVAVAANPGKDVSSHKD